VLTPAEWRVVQAVRHGMTNAAIAARQGISRDAVKFHVRNALAKLMLRTRADLRRWRGAPKASAIRAQSQRQEIVMTGTFEALGPIGQISRSVRDVDEACVWYGKKLGLKHLFTFGKLAFFDCGGTRLLLSAEGAPGPESILYFRTLDMNAAHATLTERGVEFLGAPHMIHRHADGSEEWMAFFKDPEGRPLALMSLVRS
jgi:DNA-binding CsgD family transcriptional regulator/catechol 2,3-dioxygenase-like lactoylglutathione lyase family enzyme